MLCKSSRSVAEDSICAWPILFAAYRAVPQNLRHEGSGSAPSGYSRKSSTAISGDMPGTASHRRPVCSRRCVGCSDLWRRWHNSPLPSGTPPIQDPALVVPCGSGNDFAKALGIRNVKIAFAAWKHFCRSGDNIRAVDLGVIRTRDKEILFCCVAGGGLDAKSNALANRMPAWLRARGGYVLAALRSLATGQPQEIRVATPEMHLTGPGWLAAVANAGSYGGGLKIAPQASLDDGMLDVCRVAKMNKIKLLCAFPMLFSGTHVRLKEVEYFKTAAVRLESNPALEIYAD